MFFRKKKDCPLLYFQVQTGCKFHKSGGAVPGITQSQVNNWNWVLHNGIVPVVPFITGAT